jgi:sugar transferase (PEP-CTERM/EpsH1 system associated)
LARKTSIDMKILFVCLEYPVPPINGDRVIVKNLLTQLSPRHEITLVTVMNNELDWEEAPDWHRRIDLDLELLPKRNHPETFAAKLRRLPNPYQKYPDIATKLEQLVTERPYDFAHIDSPAMAVYHESLRNLPRLLSVHDSLSLHAKRRQYFSPPKTPTGRLRLALWIHRLEQFEKNYYNKFERIHVVAKPDSNALKLINPNLNITIIPNGVDIDYYKPARTAENRHPTLVFSGNMTYLPNQDAMLYFYDSIWPTIVAKLPTVKLFIVGHNPPTHFREAFSSEQRIVVTGTVPDIRPYINSADVYICPMRLGSGIKNKVLEAMAMEMPIVASPMSCDGIEAKDGVHLSIEEHEGPFADKVVELLNRPGLQSRLGSQARKLVVEKYSWHSIAKRFEEVYRSMTE